MVVNCQRRFLFALDGFDLDFEQFRNSYILLEEGDQTKESKSEFERAWLTGLLRSVLDVRGANSLLGSKMDFCVTIPQDRYLEVRSTERDDYRYRDLAAEIRWTGYELAILLWKRLERLIGYTSSRGNSTPLSRLQEVLDNDQYRFPVNVSISSGKSTVSVSLFKYLLRHTFWRPRDVLFIFAALISTNKSLIKLGRQLTPDIVKEVVSRTTFDIIYSEFIREYEANFTNISQVIKLFEGSESILPYQNINKLIDDAKLVTNGGANSISSNSEIINTLFEIGFLGMIVSDRLKRLGLRGAEYFSFSDGDHIYFMLDEDQKSREQFCIHPIFSEYLMLNVKSGADTASSRILCVYTDDYLASNDLLAVL